jgi:hypothetical protein
MFFDPYKQWMTRKAMTNDARSLGPKKIFVAIFGAIDKDIKERQKSAHPTCTLQRNS